MSDRADDAFERAVETVIAGDLAQLRTLLRESPALVHTRSARPHGATLLHYVAANGVEDERQVTPPNIVEVARLLLESGADVNATCEAYGGGATTFGLVITSAHPRAAGVQIALASLLLEHGATIQPLAVRDCLANGCPEAAAFVADVLLTRGVTLRIDEAAGTGRVDLVKALLVSTPLDDPCVADGVQNAAWYDQRAVLDALFAHGVSVDIPASNGGGTALHVASYLGNAELVSHLLALGASVHVRDRRWNSTPLVWAQHARTVDGRGPADNYERTMVLLREAGARE